jgi:hypothetical protein
VSGWSSLLSGFCALIVAGRKKQKDTAASDRNKERIGFLQEHRMKEFYTAGRKKGKIRGGSVFCQGLTLIK